MPVLETPADAGLDSGWILLCHVSPALVKSNVMLLQARKAAKFLPPS